jgi:hypothetical protein
VKEKMKPFFVFSIACCALSVAAAAEKSSTNPQALVDLKNLRNGLHTKTDIVGRFFKLLRSGSSDPSNENPETRDKSDSRTSYISKSFRRLNIFGLQAPPDEPMRDANGQPESKQLVPDILQFKDKPEISQPVSSFSVVWPKSAQSSFQKSVEVPLENHHYKKLDLDKLFQQPSGSVQQQPTSFHYQTIPESFEQQQQDQNEHNQYQNEPEQYQNEHQPHYFHV